MTKREALDKAGVPKDCPGRYFGPYWGSHGTWVGNVYMFIERVHCSDGYLRKEGPCVSCPLKNGHSKETDRYPATSS